MGNDFSDVLDYFDKYTAEQLKTLLYLHDRITGLEGMQPKLKYKIPFYYKNSWVCYLNAVKGGLVEMAFTRGNEFTRCTKYLDFKGRKQVASIIYKSVEQIDEDILELVLSEALEIDNTKYVSPGYKKNKKHPK